jgi:hypothetical protein
MNQEDRFVFYIVGIICLAFALTNLIPGLSGQELYKPQIETRIVENHKCRRFVCFKRRARIQNFNQGVYFVTNRNKIRATYGTANWAKSIAWGRKEGIPVAELIWSGVESFEVDDAKERQISLEAHFIFLDDWLKEQALHCKQVSIRPGKCQKELFLPYNRRKFYNDRTPGPVQKPFWEIQSYDL